MDQLSKDEAAVSGMIFIVYNGERRNGDCRAIFGSTTIKLDRSGIVLVGLKKGWSKLTRIECVDTSAYHYDFKNARFYAQGDGWVTYFGNIVIDWRTKGGFKPHVLVGLAGPAALVGATLVDEASNDGVAQMSVVDRPDPVRAAFKKHTGIDGKWVTRLMNASP